MCVPVVFLYDERIYMFSELNRGLIIIDPVLNKIKEMFQILPDDEKISYGSTLLDEDILYFSSSNKGLVFGYDLKAKKLAVYEIPEMENGINTIAKFNRDTLILTGCMRKIVFWSIDRGIVKCIEKLPENFGILKKKNEEFVVYKSNVYDEPLFYKSVSLLKYIFFIPFRTNMVLFLNKETMELGEVFIPDEEEDISLKRRIFKCKYLVEYIRQNRYLGLYSCKNEYLIEIDAVSMQVKIKHIFMEKNSMLHVMQKVKEERAVVKDWSQWEKKYFYDMIFNSEGCIAEKADMRVGEKIYYEIISSLDN